MSLAAATAWSLVVRIGAGGNHCGGSIMVGNTYWMPPPRQFQPMFQEFSTQSNCYATSRK